MLALGKRAVRKMKRTKRLPLAMGGHWIAPQCHRASYGVIAVADSAYALQDLIDASNVMEMSPTLFKHLGHLQSHEVVT